MTPQIDYTVAFMAGILASGHCLGMCGSLVSAFFIKFGDNNKGALPYIAYHGARIGVYTLIGLIAALIGLALVSTGVIGKVQGILQIIAGTVVILLGLDILGWSPFRLPVLRVPIGIFRTAFLKASDKGPLAGAAMGGVMNGFMPCALTLAMAVKATAVEQLYQGPLLLLAFGLGTLPSMLFVSVLFGRLGSKVRGLMLKLAAVFVIGLGISTIQQGVTFLDVMWALPNW